MKTYVKLPDNLVKELDIYSAKFGLSKSGFIAYSLAKHINELKYQADAYKAVTDKISTIMDDMSDKGVSDNVHESLPYPEDEMPDNY